MDVASTNLFPCIIGKETTSQCQSTSMPNKGLTFFKDLSLQDQQLISRRTGISFHE